MIPVNQPIFNGNEERYLNEAIRSGWVGTAGPFVRRFEEALAGYTGRKHAIAVSSGTAALDVAVTALELDNAEVIAPVFTYISTVTQLRRLTPWVKYVDCDPFTFNIDVQKIEAQITPRTKAIIVAHLYGTPVDMDPVLALAEKYELNVIEDAAQAVGWEYKGRKCGSFEDISTFSFFGSKTISCGEGGMILTDDDELAYRCRSLSGMATDSTHRYRHLELGWNARMTNLQAAVGLAQFEWLPWLLGRKQAVGEIYDARLKDLPIQRPVRPNYYWAYPILFQQNAAPIAAKLRAKGVDTRPFFVPMHMQPALGYQLLGAYPFAEQVSRRGLCLPVGPADFDIDRVIHALEDVLGD